eukprot:Opistho-1_new@98679
MSLMRAFEATVKFLAVGLPVVSLGIAIEWFQKKEGGVGLDNVDCSKGDCARNLHPLLMVCAFGVASSWAGVAYRVLPVPRPLQKTVHLFLQTAAFVLAVVGVYAIWRHHAKHNIPHLYSFHAWLGLIVMILFGLQLFIGFVTYFFPRAPEAQRKQYSPFHIFFGVFIYVIAIATISIGLNEWAFLMHDADGDTYGDRPAWARLANALGVILWATVACVAGAVYIGRGRDLEAAQQHQPLGETTGLLKA